MDGISVLKWIKFDPLYYWGYISHHFIHLFVFVIIIIQVCPQANVLWDEFSVEEHLKIHAGMIFNQYH